MIALASLLGAAAVWLWFPATAEPRARALLPAPVALTRPASPLTPARVAAFCAALGLLLLVGGVMGALGAVACLVLVPRAAARLETRAARDRRARLLAQAPVVADLLAAALSAGAPMRAVLAAVRGAVDDPAREVLRPVLAALDLGADPASAWAPLTGDPALGAVAAAAVRSARTGAPLSALLTRVADDLRREHHGVVTVAARSAGVRAVVPLAACFLPAFLLLGVVPVVASLAGGLFS